MQVDDEHLSLTDQKDQVRDTDSQMGFYTLMAGRRWSCGG